MKLPKITLTKHYRIYLWLGTAMMVAGGAVAGIIIPGLNRLDGLTQTTIQALQDSTLSDATISTIIKTRRNRAIYTEQLEQLQAAFIQDNNPLPYLTALETVASQRSVQLEFDISQTSSATAPAELQTVLTTLTVTGSWDNVIAFTNDLMTQPVYFATESLEVAHTGTNDTVTLSLSGNTSWQ